MSIILIDPRDGNDEKHKVSKELARLIQRMGVTAKAHKIEFGDFAFEGNVDGGRALIGIERKTIYDLLQCIQTSRLSASQKPGMERMFAHRYVIVEGVWKCSDNGYLMQSWTGGRTFNFVRLRSSNVLFSTFYRYLISLQLAGMPVIYSFDLQQTAINVVEHYHWFSKPWNEHKAMLQMQQLNLPCITGKPSLVRQWAACIDGVGMELSSRAAEAFHTPFELAAADAEDWASIKGIGKPAAQKIVKQILEG